MKKFDNGLASFGIFSVWTLLAGCGGGPIVIPDSYAVYNSKDGTFQCEYPEGWEAKGGGKNGPVWAKFSSGGALVHVKASLVGSLANDAMGGTSLDSDLAAPQFEPVHFIHVAFAEDAQREFDQYTEVAGGPVVLKCSLGPARVSEFTAATSFGSQLHGYRATMLGHDKSVTVYCTCPEDDWKTAQPIYQAILATFARGSRE